jgi:hypothetical protein
VGKRGLNSRGKTEVSENVEPDRCVAWVSKDLSYLNFFFLLIASLFLSLIFTLRVGWTSLVHDLVSYLAPAVFLLNQDLSPYGTFFDIKPPFLIYSLIPWVAVFGQSLLSMAFLHGTLLFLHLILPFFIALLLSRRMSIAWITFGAQALWITSSDAYFGMLVTSELLGNVYALSSILLLLAASKELKKSSAALFILSGLLAGFATLTKEVYVGVAFAVVIGALLLPSGKRATSAAFVGLGGLVSIILVLSTLVMTGDLENYWEILLLKSNLFPSPTLGIFISSLPLLLAQISDNLAPFIPWLLLVAFVFLTLGYKKLPRMDRSRIFFGGVTGLSMLFSLTWQAKPMSGHYLISAFVPLLLVFPILISSVASLAKELRPRKATGISVMAIILIVFTAIPAPNALLAGQKASLEELSNLGTLGTISLETSAEDTSTLEALAAKSSCIQVAYGWAAAANYLAANRPPCSQFFLVNLILASPELLVQFRNDLILNPPELVVYSPDGADLSVEDFESNVFPWRAIVENCYEETELANVFVLNYSPSESIGCFDGFIR